MQMFYFSYHYTSLIVSLVVPPPSYIILGKIEVNKSFIVLLHCYVRWPDHTRVMGCPASRSRSHWVMQVVILLAREPLVAQVDCL